MRLWSLHPKYLDRIGLIACWRESLLAKKVLENETNGYRRHPQLERFKNYSNPEDAINSYLFFLFLEAKNRGYNFDLSKIEIKKLEKIISLNSGQLDYEFAHLEYKLSKRDRLQFDENKSKKRIICNPVFFIKDGGIENWEKILDT
ncbi:MAG: pyrimidine dimer DNA glycosylase/endonuclease V [Bacteroidota bacterium]|jgi:hypothetical protein